MQTTGERHNIPTWNVAFGAGGVADEGFGLVLDEELVNVVREVVRSDTCARGREQCQMSV